jgi:hypothetical protein
MRSLVLAVALFVSASAHAAYNYNGSYTGKFNNEITTINVTYDGTVMTATLLNGSLVTQCGASIGPMTAMDTDIVKGQTQVDWAEFSFDPGTCSYIAGSTITLDFKHADGDIVSGLTASLLYSVTTVPGRCHTNGQGGTWCEPPTTNYNYLDGRLKKQ